MMETAGLLLMLVAAFLGGYALGINRTLRGQQADGEGSDATEEAINRQEPAQPAPPPWMQHDTPYFELPNDTRPPRATG